MQKKIDVRDLTKIALCTSLCCVTAFIAFPLPFTPGMVTALTITMSLTAYILNPRETFLVIFLYLLIGAVGIPVFGGMGAGRLFSPVGGFYFAWLVAYPILSFCKGEEINFKRYVVTNILTAIPITYVGGIISMILVLKINLWEALTMAVFPFVFGDILKAIAAALLAVKLQKRLKGSF